MYNFNKEFFVNNRLPIFRLMCLLLCASTVVFADNNSWESFWEMFWGPKINYSAVQFDVQDELDRLFFNKLEFISPEMQNVRFQMSKNIVELIKSSNLDSQVQAKEQAVAAVKPAIKQFVVDLGTKKIVQEIGSYYHGRPPYNPEQFEQRIKQELAQQIDDAFRKNKNVTQLLSMSKLKEIIEQYDNQYALQAGGVYHKLDKELPQLYAGQTVAGEDVPAGAPVDNVHELYPQFNDKTAEGLERNKKFYGPFFEKVKQFRAEECPICSENFDAHCARVNLYCGHSLCATCLAGHVHINDKNQCPTCRQEVRASEFPVNYLRDFINREDLKQQFPRMHDKIRRLFRF